MKFEALVSKKTSIEDAISIMGSSTMNKHIAGVVVVVDENNQVTGIVTDGDVRRGLGKGIGIEQSVSKIANISPLLVVLI